MLLHPRRAARGLRAPCGRWHVPLPRFMPKFDARRSRRKKPHAPPSLRFRAPDESVTFEDLYCGPQNINVQSTFGDFIVRRSDGVHAYQLAVTVDDALMGVTEVIRGRDLLPSTGCQIQLFHALGHTPPHYGHIPLLVNRDGRRLSKRRARPRHRRSAHAFHARTTPRPHGKFTWFPRPPGKNHPNRSHPGLQSVV